MKMKSERELKYLFRHCEEQSDEAIQHLQLQRQLDCFAALAMTVYI